MTQTGSQKARPKGRTGAAAAGGKPQKEKRGPDLERLIQSARKLLYLPDPAGLEFMLGGWVANRLNGDPVWPMLIGGPSSGKNELLDGLQNMPKVHYGSSITEAGLLSGTKESERTADATGGLLVQIGDGGFLILKDFTTILSMSNDARSKLLAAFREIHSGDYTRGIGVDGGKTLQWKGKITLICGVTGVIDSHAELINKMGARYLFFRLPELMAKQQDEQAARVLDQGGRQRELRQQFAIAVSSFLSGQHLLDAIRLKNKQARPVADCDREWLIPLANLVAQARSTVERSGYKHEIENVHAAENSPRLLRDLEQLNSGLELIGEPRWRRKELVIKAGLDCLPPIRRKALAHVAGQPEPCRTDKIAEALSLPDSTVRRALEDLECHRVLLCEKIAVAHKWSLTDDFKRRWSVLSPS